MTAPLAPSSAPAIAAALREAGVDLAPDALAPEQRDGRIVVALPGERLAWFPTSFRYLVFDVGVFEPLEAALAVYEPATGVAIDRARVLLDNAGCALSFLADRHGHAADARPCGRTLAEDLRWVRGALARLQVSRTDRS